MLSISGHPVLYSPMALEELGGWKGIYVDILDSMKYFWIQMCQNSTFTLFLKKYLSFYLI